MEFNAAVLHRVGGPPSIERVAVDGLWPDDVLVRVHASGLRHTDLEVVHGSHVRAVVRMEH